MPFKKIKRAVKKITKPIAKVLDKVVPNEIKPFLPYAAALTPFALGPTFGTGFGSGIFRTAAGQQMAARALTSTAANLASQLSQEGSEGDFSGISTLLAATQGALTAPGAEGVFASKAAEMNPGILKSGTEFVGKTAKGLGEMSELIRPGGATPGLNLATAQAVSVPFTQGSIDLGMATARKALQDYEQALLDYEAETGAAQTASDTARRTAVIEAMTAGQHSDDVINETLTLLGLDTLLAKDGGVVKMKDGGIMDLGGKEMDLRGGGFVPIGKKERADDVPARLSKNEFVMTADAVRGAGGGNINEGARRMYETMNRLEARA